MIGNPNKFHLQYYNLGHASDLYVPQVNFLHSRPERISFLAPNIWATLPDKIREIKKVEACKDDIKKIENRKITPVEKVLFD